MSQIQNPQKNSPYISIQQGQIYSAHISISYQYGIRANADIVELNFTNTIFDLTDTDVEPISQTETTL